MNSFPITVTRLMFAIAPDVLKPIVPGCAT